MDRLQGRGHIRGMKTNASLRKASAMFAMSILSHLQKALDRWVAARAAREVPEWKMRAVQAQIARHAERGKIARKF